jgi:LysR family glycine cleavage system transcriptional activator
MTQRTPSFNSLRAFEAVARLRSFRKAADELFVTPAAITHQIKALEAQLGIPLFVRLSHGIELTPAAEAALPRLQQGFEMLLHAVRDLREFGQSPRLNVAVTPTLASRWIMPRLHRFLSKYPNIDVRLMASGQAIHTSGRSHAENHNTESAQNPDVEIHFSHTRPSGDYVDHLFAVHVVPMAHPKIIDWSAPSRVPDDLRHLTLLHGDGRLHDRSQSTWAKWLKQAGALQVDARRGLQFDHSTLALKAAADGLGVTLAMPLLAAEELSENKVRILFPTVLPLEQSYFVETNPGEIDRPEVRAFRAWLLEEARQDMDFEAG